MGEVAKYKRPYIEVGQIWMAADGGNYGYRITGLRDNDALVEQIGTGSPYVIDQFKLTYRYRLYAPVDWVRPK